MTTFFGIVFHFTINTCAGWGVLCLCPGKRNWLESVTASFLIGLYAETLLIAVVGFLGLSTFTSEILIISGALALTFVAWRQKAFVICRLDAGRFRWYDGLLLVSVGEKLGFGLWELTRTPVYFEDAFVHWAGRGRALYGGANWSFDPGSPAFLGITGIRGYPLGIPVWRAVTALLSGHWNDIIARADGMFFFVAIVTTVWVAVWRFSRTRWLASGSAFILSALPLQAWHAASGYGDIAVEAFLVAALAALVRKEWLVGGILAAGAMWMKNDGLLYLPALMMFALLSPLSSEKVGGLKPFIRDRWKRATLFAAGVVTLTPWWGFKFMYFPSVEQSGQGLAWHGDAPMFLWMSVVRGSSHNIFWTFVISAILASIRPLLKDELGRSLAGMFFLCLLAIFFVFGFTGSFVVLKDQTAIHRIMLQVYGIAIMVASYATWLKIRPSTGTQVKSSKPR